MKFFVKSLLTFSTAISCIQVHAQFRKYSNEFLNIGAGARGLGMGGAIVASVTDGTAGYWNPAALVHVKRALLVAIDTLGLVDKCKDAATDKLKIACLVEGLMKLSPKMRNSVLIKLASIFTAILSGDKEKESFYDAVTQAVYTAEK